jgi:site-specific DNA recombinase
VRLDNCYYDPDNDSQWIEFYMKNFTDSFSSRQLSTNINASHKKRMKDGISIITNGRMWAFRQVKNTGQVVLDEDEAEIVKFIFDSYVGGLGVKEIARKLKEKGVKNRNGGDEFSLSSIKRIIKNPAYMGTWVFGKQHKKFKKERPINIPPEDWYYHKNRVPAVVSEEVWTRANEIMDSKRLKGVPANKFNNLYPLSGRIKCGVCGETFFHSKYTSNIQAAWYCKTYKYYGKDRCDNIHMRYDDLNDILRQAVFTFIGNKDFLIKNLTEILGKSLKETRNINNFDGISKRIKTLEERKTRIRNLLYDSVITKEVYVKDTQEIDIKIAELESKITEIDKENEEKQTKIERLNLISKRLKNLKILNSDSISDDNLKNYIEEIIVFPDGLLKIKMIGGIPLTAKYERKPMKRRTKAEIEAAAQE